ncbi:MAG: hypothetical protein MUO57_13205 [Anaerolineales bacterium]|nr:hypothetical protein [Anaerolineales bacterium]
MTGKYSIKIITLLVGTFMLLVAAGCQPATTSTEIVENVLNESPTAAPVQSSPTIEPYEFAVSESGYITLHGLLVVRDPISLLPAPDDAIHLVPVGAEGQGVSGIPQFTVGEVPQADVDERTGEFVFVNIEPGKYAVVVVTKGGAQIPTRSMEDGAYSIMTFTAAEVDQTVELGSLSLP